MTTLKAICLCKHGLMQTRSAVQNNVADKMTSGFVSCLQQKTGLHLNKDWTQIRGVSSKTDIDKNIKEFKEGKFDKIPDPTHLEHFRKTDKPAITQQTSNLPVTTDDPPPIGTHTLPHPIWTDEELHNVQITHNPPVKFVDKMAYYSVKAMRKSFDILTRFDWGERNEKKWVLRICFLETVAGVPGMVAAMTRHLHSLRRMQRDYGWIHTLLEEAENERMHLMTALQLRQPTWLFRTCVIGAQGVFVTMFSLSYLLSPRFCHRFVGYLEEEAVITYSKCLKDIENGSLKHWNTQPAPEVALRYWKLAPEATMKDVILAIRADEAHHRVVNHTLASMNEKQYNPYEPGK
uniref:Alternative oxidase n=1 Tax=Anadara broughtonii TaxID=148819 RepID=A0A7U1GGC9_ANABR|nr:alternative oxidase [Anadara broughtonii]